LTVLEAESLWKIFGATVALRDVSLSLGRGLHVLAGPNGSGKTTLLKIWAGLLKPSRGHARALGLNPWLNRSKLLGRLHVAFEDIPLPWWTTGVDYMKHVAHSRGVKWGDVVELAERLGVAGYWGRPIRGYSSGMRKRVLLLQALIGEPEVIVLDEPYTLLDLNSITSLHSVIEEKLRRGATIIIATHIFTKLEDKADTLTILHNGAVLAHTTRESLSETSRMVCEDREAVEEIAREAVERVEKVVIEGDRVTLMASSFKPHQGTLEKCRREVSLKDFYERELTRRM